MTPSAPAGPSRLKAGSLGEVEERVPQLLWRSSLTQGGELGLLYPETMNTLELWQYVRHGPERTDRPALRDQLRRRAISADVCRHVDAGPAFSPICTDARAGCLKVFGGIMLGVSFLLLNELSNSLGLLQNWRPGLPPRSLPASSCCCR